MNRILRSLALIVVLMAAAISGAEVSAQPIHGMDAILSAAPSGERPDVIIVGERHGTVEAPAFVHELAVSYAGNGVSVGVVLEQSESLNDAYGGAGAGMSGRTAYCAALDDAMSWNRDGRTSEALGNLAVDLSRAAREHALPIRVYGMGLTSPIPEDIDVAPTTYRRDYHAANIAEVAQQEELTLVLVGRAHPPALKRRLVELHDLEVLTVGMMWDPGQAWNSQRGRCQIHSERGYSHPMADGASAPAILGIPDQRMDLMVYLGPISSSPPTLRSGWCEGPAAVDAEGR